MCAAEQRRVSFRDLCHINSVLNTPVTNYEGGIPGIENGAPVARGAALPFLGQLSVLFLLHPGIDTCSFCQ